MGSNTSKPSAPNRPFAGKTSEIAAQHAAFQAQPAAAADVAAYRRGDATHAYADLPSWVRASTPFTAWAGADLAESDNVLIVGNHASFAAAQYPGAPERAGMSAVHLLAIPKAGIYNGVSLERGDAGLIDEMMSLFRRSWPDPAFRSAVLRHQADRVEAQGRASAEGLGGLECRTALGRLNKLSNKIVHGLTVDDFAFGFHLYPDHSVAHLHMHIVATRKSLRRYSTYAHDAKTKDALEVRDFIRDHAQN
ncbi:hypothetical protein GGR52DRAFT_592760 [Hypoxylon sp. FL1284]|nr:hypothetical protein GGR52DRAFT_592760 [Hypoxylon sp. FL1284]